MIIKEADDRQAHVRALEALAKRHDASPQLQKQIELERRKLLAGIKGEREAAYEVDFHFGQSRNYMVLHDLRVVCGSRVAQIDHLIIDRLLEVYVCETKHFSGGVSINEAGEFTAYSAGRSYGIPSPIEQNERHITVLRQLTEGGFLTLPTRLGLTIKPVFHNLVLVSKSARITRPRSADDTRGLASVNKVDQFCAWMDKQMNDSSPLKLARVVSVGTLEAFAQSLAQLHQAASFDYAARFGLAEQANAKEVCEEKRVTPEVEGPDSRYRCARCSVAVELKVARFCWLNKKKFGGKVLCRVCQAAAHD